LRVRKKVDSGRPRRVTYWKWVERFRPIRNHLTAGTAIDGYVFLPDGEDFEFVSRQPELTIWTFLICDGRWYIDSGFHYVNREGYLITEVPIGPDEWWSIYY
jgi:hypothetical protein